MDVYASVLRLDRKANKALKITDTYSLHRVIYSLFEDSRSEAEKKTSDSSGIQWVDKGGDFACRQILMLSQRPPKSCIDGEYGEVQTKVIPSSFFKHTTYRFEVIVNPCRRDSQSKKLIPVKGREDIAQWFIERGKKSWGFAVSEQHLQIDHVSVLKFKEKNQREIVLQQAKITGYLTVSDPNLFSKSAQNGIGKARTWGCGLLQIVPVIDCAFI